MSNVIKNGETSSFVGDDHLTPAEFERAMAILESPQAMWALLPPDEAIERERRYRFALDSVVAAKNGAIRTTRRNGHMLIWLKGIDET